MSLCSLGKYPSSVRPSALSNDISSETTKSIVTKFHTQDLLAGGTNSTVFIQTAPELWLLWQLKVATDLKTCIYCYYVIADILTNLLQK